MADLSAEQLGDEQSKFEVANLGALSALEAANPEVVDLQVAENISLITAETRQKIEDAVPNHELLFQRALAKERREAGADNAFKRAFETVYGKFLMEQGDDELTNPRGKLVKKLSSVLKFPIAPTGLKGRTELLAAVRRLKMLRLANQQGLNALGGGGAVSATPDDIIDKAFATKTSAAKRKELERKWESAKGDRDGLKETANYFGSDKERGDLDESFNTLGTLLREAGLKPGDTESFKTKLLRFEEEASALSGVRTNQNKSSNPQQLVNARFTASKKDFDARVAKEIYDRKLANPEEIAEAKTRIEAEMRREIEAKIEEERMNVMIEGSINLGKRRGEKRDKLKILQSAQRASEGLHGKLKIFFDRLTKAHKAGVKFKNKTGGADLDVEALDIKFKTINLESNDFSPMDLTKLYGKIQAFFGAEKNRKAVMTEFDKKLAKNDDTVDKAKKALDTAKSEIVQVSNLTDSQAAKRLVAAIVAEQNPDMSLADQQKLASMILANDIATMQTEASYDDLAKRGSAELLDTVRQAGFRRKLIGFQYKEGDKAMQPFKGLKPGQFKDWPEIERLFKIGRLNHQNGFFVLAAMRDFDGNATSVQTVKLERKLKTVLAEELGVDERMDEAGIDKILNKAFADQIKKAQELVKAYFQHFDRNASEWDENKVKELNLRYARVREELRLGKIKDATFQKRMAELVDEAKEGEVLDQVKFSQDSAMAGYWNSPFSQWFKDRGWDIGQYAKGKAKSVALSGVKLGAYGLWGTAKLGLSVGAQMVLLPLRAAKYPLMLAAKPLVGMINLFRRQKWTPLPRIRDTIRSDAGRVVGYVANKGSETFKGTTEKLVGVPKAEWEKTPYAGKKYAERTKVDMSSLKEQAEELKAKGDPTPVEVAGSPFIDLKKYRDEIARLDRILAQKPVEERGEAAGEKRAAA